MIRSYPLPQRAFQQLVAIQVLLGNHLKERDRERRNVERRIRLARFPQTKSFDTFDFAAQPSLNKALVLELTRCEWIDRRQNCLALGPSSTGKTD
jgi:DNA replication protein DnaC